VVDKKEKGGREGGGEGRRKDVGAWREVSRIADDTGKKGGREREEGGERRNVREKCEVAKRK